MNGAATLVVEVDPQRIARRLATRYLDEATDSLDDALAKVGRWTRERVGRSVGLRGNAADVLPALVARGVTPDVLTDQTSAHDALNGYVPNGLTLDEANRLRDRSPDEYIARSMAAMAEHVRAMLTLRQRGAITFDYGNNLRAQAQAGRRRQRLRHPGLRARVHPAAVLRRQGTVPLGRALGRSRRHPRHRRRGARDVRRTTRRWCAGSTSRASASRSRGCRRASCGSATASARGSACGSTSWCATGASRRRSSSAAIISTPDRSRRPIARPKG